MKRIAALFPGQGSQSVGMGRDLAERFVEAADVFREVDEALGEPLSRLCWEGPEEQLRLTANTQPALLAHSVAAWRVLAHRGLEVCAGAGHSLGEYSAVVAAGSLSLADAARIVRRRGELMQEAVPVGAGAMSAVIGLEDDLVIEACEAMSRELGEAVVAANFNAPGQVVIAGSSAAVEAAGAACRDRGARRVMPLPVSAPFHSPLMAPARAALEPTLRAATFAEPAFAIYRNVDAAPVRSGAEIMDGLVRHVDSPVLWSETIRRLRGDGFETFVEIGTGSVLSGLVRRVDRSATCFAVGDPEQTERLIDALDRHREEEADG
jgi:[acyl-carrier-protein] S-malonyltransferase